MAIVLNGSLGIQNPLGSAAAPSESNTTNSNTGAYFPTGTTYGIATNGSNAMYIDASQNVGIGTTSPTSKIHAYVASGGITTLTNSNGTTVSDYAQVLSKAGTITTEVTTYGSGLSYVFSNASTAMNIGSTGAAYVAFYSNNAERMRIDSSGNVGIGTTSPSAKLDVVGAQWFRGAASTGALGVLTADGTSGANGISIAASFVTGGYGPIKLFTSNTEAARIDSSGNLLVNTTTAFGRFTVLHAGASQFGITTVNTDTSGAGQTSIAFQRNGSYVGSINTTSTATSYNTSSDYRLKHDVQPMQNALTTISALNPVTYKWNTDNSKGEGFIAHELQAIIPLAVTGDKDAVDDEGNPIHQGVDYSKIVVHLVAAIQELTAEVTALKAKVGA